MDPGIDHRLRLQQQSLQSTLLALSHTRARLACVAPESAWTGPASIAYRGALERLRRDLATAEARLEDALHFTRRSIATRGGS